MQYDISITVHTCSGVVIPPWEAVRLPELEMGTPEEIMRSPTAEMMLRLACGGLRVVGAVEAGRLVPSVICTAHR